MVSNEIENKIFFSKYKPEKKIGEGSFGRIYSAINVNTNEKFALKLETKSSTQNLLESEAYVLCYLKGVGIPIVKSYGFSGDSNVLVMELLGKSLEDLFQDCGGKFSLKTTCMLGYQMLERIEYVHTRHIIHRDIKPDNFVMGLDSHSTTVYVIDFGLAKKYRSSRTLQHIGFKNNKKLTGTARYASINALKGVEQSRRDDLEAIGYVMMYFLRGVLPWQGLKVDKKEDRYKKIYEKKKATTPEELCDGYPPEFMAYIKYTRELLFEQEPDYNYLRGLLTRVAENNKFTFDLVFDWDKGAKNQAPVNKNSLNTINTQYSNINQNYQTNNSNIKPEQLKKNDKENLKDLTQTKKEYKDDEINKPKNFITNETKPKFEENLNKTNPKIEKVKTLTPERKKDDKQNIERSRTSKDEKCMIV